MTKSRYQLPKASILGWARDHRWPNTVYHLARQTSDGKISIKRVCGAVIVRRSFVPINPPPIDRRCKRCLFTREYEEWTKEMLGSQAQRRHLRRILDHDDPAKRDLDAWHLSGRIFEKIKVP